jgi:hypothetical protein
MSRRASRSGMIVDFKSTPLEPLALKARVVQLIVGGDEVAARAWLTAENSTLQGRPIELIQRAHGLANVVSYLEARRALS